MQIDYKSTATLFNELSTTRLKIKNIGPEEAFKQRERDIIEALGKRRRWLEILPDIINDINQLHEVLEDLWWHQETLYQAINFDFGSASKEEIQEIALAGINSLLLNRNRSKLIRKIDQTLGEESTTVLEKSWK